MAPRTAGRRAGFTLIELLVAMTIIVVLATIALAVIPGALDQDRTTDAAATIRQHLMIAKARATRENNGRGVRFIVSYNPANPAAPDPNNLQKTNAAWATEMQYIEAAPTVIPNPYGLTGAGDPYVEPTNGSTWTLKNMPALSEAIQVMQNDLGAYWFPKLYMPELGKDSFGRTQRFEVFKLDPIGGTNDWTLTVAVGTMPPPMLTLLGSGTNNRSYRFAIEPRSRPLLGEPNITLPKNVCVDLEASTPSVRVVPIPDSTAPGGVRNIPTDYEVMFAPNGQVIDPVSSGQIFLWVRDFTKFSVNPAKNNGGTPPVYDMTAFQQGGEQQVIAIKAKTGGLGVFPIAWPDVISGSAGTYSTGDPFLFARRESSSP